MSTVFRTAYLYLYLYHLILLHKVTSYRHLLHSSDALRHNLFLVFYSINMMMIVYYKHYSA